MASRSVFLATPRSPMPSWSVWCRRSLAGIAGVLQLKEYFLRPPGRCRQAKRAGDADADDRVPAYTAELADEAICHRNVTLGEREGVFLSTRLLGDKFAVAFELFINVGHGFVEALGVPESFAGMCWAQALADVRGETSQDAWEDRATALVDKAKVDEKSRTSYLEAAFADALAIYLLSLAVLTSITRSCGSGSIRLLAPQALAERLRLVAKLFPPNTGY